MKNEYKNLREVAFDNGNDTNFCTVISASIVFDKDYKQTHKFFAENGRKNGKGINPSEIYKKLAKLENYKIKEFHRKNFNGLYCFQNNGEILTIMEKFTSITVNNFRDYLPPKDYIFGIRKHVLAVKNGIIQDWTAYRQGNRKQGTCKARLDRIWTIEKS